MAVASAIVRGPSGSHSNHNNDSDNLSCNISDSISDMKLNEEANDKINSQSLLELFGTINTIIDKQMYFSKITKDNDFFFLTQKVIPAPLYYFYNSKIVL